MKLWFMYTQNKKIQWPAIQGGLAAIFLYFPLWYLTLWKLQGKGVLFCIGMSLTHVNTMSTDDVAEQPAKRGCKPGSKPLFIKVCPITYAIWPKLDAEQTLVGSVRGFGASDQLVSHTHHSPKKDRGIQTCGDPKVTLNPVLQHWRRTLFNHNRRNVKKTAD